MRLGDGLEYLRDTYGISWSRPTLKRYIKVGSLRGSQPGGPGGWWLVSRESIDDMFGPKESPEEPHDT